jgi:3'(2'), 5'-bisphosphate nucleotidase
MQARISNTEEGLARALVTLARAAAQEVMAVYATNFTVASKEDASPVTLADQRAEAVILEGLAKIEPGVGVIAEEAYSRGQAGTAGDTFFLVDPLDGTREFIGRNGEFTVNIALVDGGRPVVGVIVAPAQSRTFFAWRGGRAFEARATDGERTIGARAVPAKRRVAIASRSHRDPATDAYLAALGVEDVRSAGSSLKFCLLAAGEADVYPRFGPTCEWDIAAGHAILSAAGGDLCGLDGEPLIYGKSAAGFRNPGFIAWGAGPRPDLPDRSS